MSEFEVTGQYKPCSECAAPIVTPFPNDWTLTISPDRASHDGPLLPVTMTPHTPGCTGGTMTGISKPEPTLTDPPGLDAAIEAAAYELDWIERVNVEAAVRAAAPALRAGALREAADEWEAKGWTGFARLRARADRIGGAT